MNENVFSKLAKVLDTLPNGFPATPTGIEIKILKKIFLPEEAELFCDLRLNPETAEEVAKRTGRPTEGLEDSLTRMYKRGEITVENRRGVKTFRMMPWIIGIYEFQLKRMDKEFAQMCEEYSMYWGAQFLKHGPRVMQVIPIEREIPVRQEALTYEQVSNMIDKGFSFMVNECICRKKQGLLGQRCDKPLETCLGIDPQPDFYKDHPWGGRVISKQEAYDVLRNAEEAGLVHMTSNVESGHWFICNCCGCCCGLLRAVNMGLPNVVNSYYYAEINAEQCDACGICAEERCQVHAIEESNGAFRVKRDRCIGCGLCVTACPSEAISLFRKKPEEIHVPPKDGMGWLEERARQRGVDYSAYK